MGKKPPSKEEPGEYGRFKDLLRRIVAVPKEEADEKMEEHRKQRAKSAQAKSH
jgi:hypothetical protein